ncbi:hypothetical protein DPV78_003474 [Talaromyces pinophilus]|nr:hypothetical protein DPV78_003474 [Talaromyces pinophilus]
MDHRLVTGSAANHKNRARKGLVGRVKNASAMIAKEAKSSDENSEIVRYEAAFVTCLSRGIWLPEG